MKIILRKITFCLLLYFITNLVEATDTYVIPIKGMIDYGLASFVKKWVNRLEKKNPKYVIFKIDTDGGELHSAFDISDTIINASFKKIAYINTRAYSAGSLIALSCDEIIMREHSAIGDCEPIVITGEGYKTMGEKIQSPLRAKFRSLAKKNGYPIPLAEGMVDASIEVYQIKMKDGKVFYIKGRELAEFEKKYSKKILEKRLVLPKGKLLTMDAQEAKEFGFARKIIKDIDELWKIYNISKNSVIFLEMTWSEKIARFLTRSQISSLLLIIAFIAIWTELKTPGFGIPGIVGLGALSLLLGAKYIAGLAEVPEILLFLLGILLLILEIFVIPGFGIAGILGILCIFIGLYLSFTPVIIPKTPWDIKFAQQQVVLIGGSLVIAMILFFIFAKYLPSTPFLGRLTLSSSLAPLQEEVVENEDDKIGTLAYAVSPLRPAGKIKIGEEYFDAITEGEFIEKEEKVKIIGKKGSSFVVERFS